METQLFSVLLFLVEKTRPMYFWTQFPCFLFSLERLTVRVALELLGEEDPPGSSLAPGSAVRHLGL